MKNKQKICIVIGSRANYSSIKSAMVAIRAHDKLDLQVVLTASAILDRYGNVGELVSADGFQISAKVPMLIEGESPETMAKSTGLGLIELSSVFQQVAPDVVLTIGDRFETMATTLAAAYMNIPIAHTMGGEVSGTIDESIRHAVTKFSHIHFPASEQAAERIVKLGENPEQVHMVGCPRIDLVAEILNSKALKASSRIFSEGVGTVIDLNSPFLLVSQHPVTTEFGEAEAQMTETLRAVNSVALPVIVLWPNADAGSDGVAKSIRKWRELGLDSNMHFFKNLPIEEYIRLMATTACLIGNSSSGIREGAFIGTPVVNIGTRQLTRERGKNVVEVPPKAKAIEEAIRLQISHGPYKMEPIYGDGTAGVKIADVLANTTVSPQKRIWY